MEKALQEINRLIDYKKARLEEHKKKPRTSLKPDIEGAARNGEITGLMIARQILTGMKGSVMAEKRKLTKEEINTIRLGVNVAPDYGAIWNNEIVRNLLAHIDHIEKVRGELTASFAEYATHRYGCRANAFGECSCGYDNRVKLLKEGIE